MTWFSLILPLSLASASSPAFAASPATGASTWKGEAVVDGGDVWINSYEDSELRYRYRLGAGGDIAEIQDVRNDGRDLLPGPYRNERTDRIVQWVWWDNDVRVPVSAENARETRFNLNQAGTYGDGNDPRDPNGLSPTFSVSIRDGAAPEVDVISVPKDQWYPSHQRQLQCRFGALTGYRIEGRSLFVRRVLVLGQPLLELKPVDLTKCYFEAWTTFRYPVFTALAIVLDEDGVPKWWYRATKNIPMYPKIPVEKTRGYAVAYSEQDPFRGTAVGLVFGTRQPNVGQYVLNSMDFSKQPRGGLGFGMLPGIRFFNGETLPAGTVVDQTLALVPTPGMDADFAAELARVAELIPAPRIYGPDEKLDGGLQDIVRALKADMFAPGGVRTDHLGELVGRGHRSRAMVQ